MEEELFIRYIKNKDEESFKALFNSLDSWLFTMVYSITANRAEADDIIQEAWLKVIDNAENFNPDRGSFKNYIFTVAKNLALNRFKKNTNLNDNLEDYQQPTVEPEIQEEIRELNHIINEGIKRIKNKKYQDAILLYYFAGLKADEIGEVMGTEIYNILNWLKRGRRQLEKNLRSHPEFEDIHDSIKKVIYLFVMTLGI